MPTIPSGFISDVQVRMPQSASAGPGEWSRQADTSAAVGRELSDASQQAGFFMQRQAIHQQMLQNKTNVLTMHGNDEAEWKDNLSSMMRDQSQDAIGVKKNIREYLDKSFNEKIGQTAGYDPASREFYANHLHATRQSLYNEASAALDQRFLHDTLASGAANSQRNAQNIAANVGPLGESYDDLKKRDPQSFAKQDAIWQTQATAMNAQALATEKLNWENSLNLIRAQNDAMRDPNGTAEIVNRKDGGNNNPWGVKPEAWEPFAKFVENQKNNAFTSIEHARALKEQAKEDASKAQAVKNYSGLFSGQPVALYNVKAQLDQASIDGTMSQDQLKSQYEIWHTMSEHAKHPTYPSNPETMNELNARISKGDYPDPHELGVLVSAQMLNTDGVNHVWGEIQSHKNRMEDKGYRDFNVWKTDGQKYIRDSIETWSLTDVYKLGKISMAQTEYEFSKVAESMYKANPNVTNHEISVAASEYLFRTQKVLIHDHKMSFNASALKEASGYNYATLARAYQDNKLSPDKKQNEELYRTYSKIIEDNDELVKIQNAEKELKAQKSESGGVR